MWGRRCRPRSSADHLAIFVTVDLTATPVSSTPRRQSVADTVKNFKWPSDEMATFESLDDEMSSEDAGRSVHTIHESVYRFVIIQEKKS